jgi:hypothetical protein
LLLEFETSATAIYGVRRRIALLDRPMEHSRQNGNARRPSAKPDDGVLSGYPAA